MLKIFLRYFRNLRMEFQVLIINLPILILIMLVVGLSYYLQYTVIFNMLKNQSNELLTHQEYKALSLVSAQLQQYIKDKHNFYIQRLDNLNKIFGFVSMKQESYQDMNNLKNCLRFEQIANNIIEFNAPQFCYFAYGITDRITLPKQDKIINIFNQTTQLINQFTIALDATENSIISMADFTDTVYFAAYPHILLLPKYNPRTRPWYINHIEGMKTNPERNYYFSPIYKNYVKNIYQMAITYSISGKSLSNIGILTQNVELNDTNIVETPYNIIVTSENGEVVLQRIESIKTLIYIKDYILFINDTNQTGFNESDWQQMKRVAQGQEIPNKCNEFNDHAFCLYNKYFQKYVIVNATFIKEGNFYMMIYSNITSQTILNRQLYIINDNIQSKLTQSQYTILISGVTLLFLEIIIIHYIFLPLKDLMKTLYFYIKQRGNNINKEIFKLFNTKKKVKRSNTFSDLMQAFLRFEAKMHLNQQKKNKDCIYFEQIQYQNQTKNQLINPLELNLNNITNDYLTFCQIKNIFDLLKLKIFNF